MAIYPLKGSNIRVKKRAYANKKEMFSSSIQKEIKEGCQIDFHVSVSTGCKQKFGRFSLKSPL